MNLKQEVNCYVFIDGQLHNKTTERRIVYTDRQGNYVNVMGNKKRIKWSDQNVPYYEQHIRRVVPTKLVP